MKDISPLIAQQANENSDCYLKNCEIFDVFWSIQVAFVVGEHFLIWESTRCALKPGLGSFNENNVVGYQCNSYILGPLSEQKVDPFG